jgi:arginine:pyruvate transaminase
LSVGDPDLDTPAPVIARAIECMRAGDTHYTAAPGRQALREAIAALHAARTGQAVGAGNVVFMSGAQNALFGASLCLAGPGDEVIALEPGLPHLSGDDRGLGRAHGAGGDAGIDALSARCRGARSGDQRAHPRDFLCDAEQSERCDLERSGSRGDRTLARRHSLWIVADEVYAGIAPGGRVPSLAARCPIASSRSAASRNPTR